MSLRTASCSWGQLQARVNAEPLRVSVCHCLACQRRTGPSFSVYEERMHGWVQIPAGTEHMD